jgi:hypothetical protein
MRFPHFAAIAAGAILLLASCGDATTETNDAPNVDVSTSSTPKGSAPETTEDVHDHAAEDHEADEHEAHDDEADEHEDEHEHEAVDALAGDADPAEAKTTIKVAIVDGSVEGGALSESVSTGDVVLIEVALDSADEVHLHGYDFTVAGQAGETVQIAFMATIPGVWEVELEGAGLQILELTVS